MAAKRKAVDGRGWKGRKRKLMAMLLFPRNLKLNENGEAERRRMGRGSSALNQGIPCTRNSNEKRISNWVNEYKKNSTISINSFLSYEAIICFLLHLPPTLYTLL